MTNCTFADGTVIGGTNGLASTLGFPNNDGNPGALQGANIANIGGTFVLENSILAYPTNGSNAFGTITDKGFNISSDVTPTFTNATSQTNLDPLLQSLTTNGGPTLTFNLEGDSPAIDAITDGSAPGLDQRGFSRPISPDVFATIGALEFGTPNFTISGRILPPGNFYTNVVILLTGTATSSSVSPDATGIYSFSGLVADTYVIVPQATNGFTFSPSSITLALPTGIGSGNASNQNFSATPVFNIGGIISNLTANATVSLFTNANGNNTFITQTTAGTNGLYLFTNFVAGNYTVIPQANNITAFNPSSLSVSVGPSNTNENFTAVPATFTVSGQISGTAGQVVTIVANIGSSTNSFAATTSDASGNYLFPSLSSGAYTLVPRPTNGFIFSPASIPVTVPPSTNGQNFTALTTFIISGQITNLHATATISAASSATNVSVPTDVNGKFSISNLPAGYYTVTPGAMSGATFSPASMPVTLGPSASNRFFAVIPSTQPINSVLHLTNHVASFTMNGFPNLIYRIQVSSNLVDWVNISTNTAASDGTINVQNSTVGFTNRFFRTVTP